MGGGGGVRSVKGNFLRYITIYSKNFKNVCYPVLRGGIFMKLVDLNIGHPSQVSDAIPLQVKLPVG